ncbi:hypothetical protein HKD37_06G016769 [Glycine soja]
MSQKISKASAKRKFQKALFSLSRCHSLLLPPPLKLQQSSNLWSSFLLQIAKGGHFRSREAHLYVWDLEISEWYLEICRGGQETLGTSGAVLLPKTKLDQSRPNPGIIVMAAQLIHDRVEIECLEVAWETLEGNTRCRFRGTIRFTATSLVHPDEPVRTLQRTVEWILPTPTPYRLVEPVQVIEVTSSEEDPEEDPEELPPEPDVDALDFLEGDEDPLPEVDSPEDVMSASEADSTEDSGPGEMAISGGSSS